MAKSIALLFNFAFFILFGAFFDEEIKINQSIPEKADPGEEFIVEVKINKGTITGFAKIQQDLPEGFTAEATQTAGGSFTFSDQTVKVIWMSLPEEEEVTVTYKVKLAEDVNGTFDIEGKFSYLEENERKTVRFNKATIAVGDEAIAATEPIEPPKVDITVSATRDIKHISDNEYEATITVLQTGITGFAKIQDFLPAETKATNGASDQAVFSFVDGKVKFVWMAIPENETITATYKIIYDGTDPSELNTLTGEFSYLEDNETQKITIESGTVELGESTVTTDTATDPATDPVTDPVADPVTDPVIDPITDPITDPVTDPVATNVPAPETGVTYRVQICAGHIPVEATHFETVYSFSEEAIKTENHEDWIKYTVGSYGQYSAARDRREDVNGKYEFPGPFVSAYNDGERTTVQDALMISNQKWVQ